MENGLIGCFKIIIIVLTLVFAIIGTKPSLASLCSATDTIVAFCEESKCINGFKRQGERELIPCDEEGYYEFVDATTDDLLKIERARNSAGYTASGVYEYTHNIRKSNFSTLEDAKYYWVHDKPDSLKSIRWLELLAIIIFWVIVCLISSSGETPSTAWVSSFRLCLGISLANMAAAGGVSWRVQGNKLPFSSTVSS